MGLTKSAGDMYPWVDYTWNPLGGACPHQCVYCYTKAPPVCWSGKYKTGGLRLWEKELKVQLRGLKPVRRLSLPFVPEERAVIFICSNSDLGAAETEDVERILRKCWEAPENFYLIQSKNPAGVKPLEHLFPPKTILGTTVETNRADLCRRVSSAPPPGERVKALAELKAPFKMVSVEPVMDFDPPVLAEMITQLRPNFVSIGADSGGNRLPEPPPEKVELLVRLLKGCTQVFLKENLRRLTRRLEANKSHRKLKAPVFPVAWRGEGENKRGDNLDC